MKNLLSGLRPYLTIAVVLMFLLTSCAQAAPAIGEFQVYSVQAGTVVYGINRVINGAPGAQLLQNGSQFIFMWTTPGIKNAIAFFGVDTSNCSALDVYGMVRQGGQMVNFSTGSDLTKFFMNNGWKVVPATMIPATVKTAVGLYTAVASGELTVPLFVPGTVVDYPTVEELLQPDGGQS